MRSLNNTLFLSLYYFQAAECFQLPVRVPVVRQHRHQHYHPQFKTRENSHIILNAAADEMTIEELKSELAAYLKKRDESNADESAKSEVGKVIGGTKGNAILEYVSGAPNKAQVVDEVPDIFDYNELSKYGYSSLATPIMNAGGRREMYALMGLPEPVVPNRIKKVKKVPKLVIDRTGETDEARYSGLKVTQIIDDDEMGRRLQEIQDKKKKGEFVKAKLVEEEYVMPFADKRNVSPQQTPDWTPEMLDEEGKRAGRAASWAKKAREGEFQTDPAEVLSIEGSLQLYSVVTTLITAFAFGKSSNVFLEEILHFNKSDIGPLLEFLKLPALVFVLTSVGACVVCGALIAPTKNRNSFVWGIKGFAGGPLAILQLKSLDALITRGEAEERAKNA